jgi:uncharacterized membrane protein YbhN (UPF0104 family)
VRLERWPERARAPIGRALLVMRGLARRPQLALLLFAMSLSLQSLFVLLNAALGHGLGMEVPLAFWFLAVPLAKAVTLLPISLGGFGLREVTLAAILGTIGVAEAQGVLVSLLWQTVVVATGLFGGLVWFVLGLREESPLARQSLTELSRPSASSESPRV